MPEDDNDIANGFKNITQSEYDLATEPGSKLEAVGEANRALRLKIIDELREINSNFEHLIKQLINMEG